MSTTEKVPEGYRSHGNRKQDMKELALDKKINGRPARRRLLKARKKAEAKRLKRRS